MRFSGLLASLHLNGAVHQSSLPRSRNGVSQLARSSYPCNGFAGDIRPNQQTGYTREDNLYQSQTAAGLLEIGVASQNIVQRS
jgi:hypothetical protein